MEISQLPISTTTRRTAELSRSERWELLAMDAELRLRFVNENPRIQRSMAICQAQLDNAAMSSGYPRRADSVKRLPLSQEIAWSLDISQSRPPIAFKDDIFMSFLASKLLGEGGVGNSQHSPLCGLPTRWLVRQRQADQNKAWSALAAIVFGQAHKSLDSTKNAYAMYGQALSNIRTEISVPGYLPSEDTLATMTALYMYEILASRMVYAWMSHANGIRLLFQFRGPSMYKPVDMKGIFLEHRIMLVGKSIISGTSTFLRDPIWKTVPWENDPTSKTPIDYLVDIGTDICEYNYNLKELNARLDNQDAGYHDLATEVSRSIEKLNSWWHTWEIEHGNVAAETIPPTMFTPFPTILEYNTPWDAFTICLYDVIRILLLQLWETLLPFSSSHPVILDEGNTTALLGITSDMKGPACEILRSLRYSYRMSRRFVYTVSFLVISDVAYGCFDRDSTEARWLVEHGWAELESSDDVADRNILKVVLPLGQIRIG
ncbi:hypothetical protein DL98DRAFT_575375 [Cadophora sp. DSE1049]|nr:hypothetical protein DL98DRAFT_575375 [Cadophora sp. DSE1049]